MSSNQAKSYHSINIGNINTWDDWHLVPSSRPVINPPQPKTSYMSVSGGDGSLDMTTYLTSKVEYGARNGSWNFIVINPGQLPSDVPFTGWTALYSEIMAYLHGKWHRVILDDDPNYYYEGRLSVANWSSEKGNSTITINYMLKPYKKHISNNNKRF